MKLHLLFQKMAEKIKGLSEDRIAELKMNYARLLYMRIEKCNRVEPCEGTIKPYEVYTEDDPMVPFMAEFDGTPLAGEEWDANNDVIYLREALDGLGI